MKTGEIWYIHWGPGRGHEFQKRRPGIIVGSEASLKHQSVITAVPLTSNLDHRCPGDILIPKDTVNNLSKDSLVRMGHINSFDPQRFLGHVGDISVTQQKAIQQSLQAHFGWD